LLGFFIKQNTDFYLLHKVPEMFVTVTAVCSLALRISSNFLSVSSRAI